MHSIVFLFFLIIFIPSPQYIAPWFSIKRANKTLFYSKSLVRNFSKTKQNKTKQNKTKQNKTKQNKTKQNKKPGEKKKEGKKEKEKQGKKGG